ncbi:DUF6346 domain-containing protein [Micromonospora sp. NPDC005367]|uniref:DUF6346 domain-containing protein n=1 Tax=Micromonospora sp. NPDC005367 TaxID=3155590 RepID=UPI0033A8DBD8
MWGRLGQLAVAVLLALGWVVTGFAFATVESLYRGTGEISSIKERPAVAQVGECRRAGPVSVNGFGYWWECQVVVRTDDGRVVEAVVRHSIVTPRDAGNDVEFREACSGSDNADCIYGRPVHRAWATAVRLVEMVEWTVKALLAFATVVYLLRAIFGVPRFQSAANRLLRKQSE